VISVLTDDDHAAGIAGEAHRLHHRIGRASRFDCYISAPSVSLVQDPFQSFAFVVLLKVEHGGSSYLGSRFEALNGRTETKHSQRATHQRQNDRVNADWAGAQYEHGVANRNLTAFDCMQRGGQSATSSHESFGIRVETDAARAWLEINLFGPTAAQSIIEAISDPVNFSVRTTRRCF